MVKSSVVMPVYNTPVPFLKEAVDSILNQTYQDFEFIIIDDCSTDDTREYLDGLTDPRIRIIRNKINLGITKSLNIGFGAAQGEYIARMDSDDIAYLQRFEKQIAFMENHPDVIVCGTKTESLGKPSSTVNAVMEDMENYRVRMLFSNPGPAHPTAFFDRRKLLQNHITYDEQLTYAQDYGMWMTVSQYGRVCILPEVLLFYRKHVNRISKVRRELQIQCDKMTQRKLLTRLLGAVTEEELDLHYVCSTGFYQEATITPQIAKWYGRLISANVRQKIYDQKKLKQRIVEIKLTLVRKKFTEDMPRAKKTLLLFRYLPFYLAAKETKKMIINPSSKARPDNVR